MCRCRFERFCGARLSHRLTIVGEVTRQPRLRKYITKTREESDGLRILIAETVE
jgi:hypothetical protein